MRGRFVGKRVLVTGANRGIGLVTARAFYLEGADVIMTARDAALGETEVARFPSLRGAGRAQFIAMDVSDSVSVRACFALFDEEGGGPDILFSNAGIATPGRIDEITEAEWDACIDINLKGGYLTAHEAIPRMRRRGGGVILFNSSNGGLVARAGDPAYSAAKHGLNALAKAMAIAHAPDRIRVNAICPGPVGGTAMVERALEQAEDRAAAVERQLSAAPLAAALKRYITTEEVAEVALFLCSDAATMITGATVAVDGGKSAGIDR